MRRLSLVEGLLDTAVACPCCRKGLLMSGECRICDRDPASCDRCVDAARSMAGEDQAFFRAILRGDRFQYAYDSDVIEEEDRAIPFDGDEAGLEESE